MAASLPYLFSKGEGLFGETIGNVLRGTAIVAAISTALLARWAYTSIKRQYLRLTITGDVLVRASASEPVDFLFAAGRFLRSRRPLTRTQLGEIHRNVKTFENLTADQQDDIDAAMAKIARRAQSSTSPRRRSGRR